MRRFAVSLCALVGALFALLSLGATAAWAEGEQGFKGVLENKDAGDEPVPGVTLRVFDAEDNEVVTAESADDGSWEALVPEAGDYRVELDASTLPDGLVVRTGRTSTDLLRVDEGQVRNALFPLGTSVTTPGGDAPEGEETAEESTTPEEECVVDEETGEEICGGGSGWLGQWGNVIYNGLHFGLIIGLAAVGLSLIFGTMGLTNFAHGELVTFGGAATYIINVSVGLPVLVAIPAAVLLGGLFGWAQDRYFWGWLRKRGTGLVTMMIISIGVALALRYLINFIMGPNTERYTDYVRQASIDLGLFQATPKKLIVDAVAITAVVIVGLVLMYTRVGKAIRAVADNPSLAAASGINVDRVIRWVWMAGAALAALAGASLALDRGVKFDMGMQLLLLIFAAVVLGGLGTAFGAIVGALIIGVFTQVSTVWMEPQLKYVGALVVLIVVLLFRPQGILGRRERIG
ncbi:branched-chain amino acid transport system permease protein [Stackebrandtia albiflava]|uniref:Branched-chain amino acid transport system permease protein n=1 Tax=Stackebrandtia albiflava TaxID=406432 RepID=A0A562VCW3_9ACTN|nr:branched-chain amino acid ABC transporter permease [Stackebrandtia albiflava]TWJ15695.1 branched-chain amino acid transport system permease protein [Stackebrandtia albiflava]